MIVPFPNLLAAAADCDAGDSDNSIANQCIESYYVRLAATTLLASDADLVTASCCGDGTITGWRGPV